MNAFAILLGVLLSCPLLAAAQAVTIEDQARTVALTYPESLSLSEAESLAEIGNYAFYELLDPRGINIRAVPVDEPRVVSVDIRAERRRFLLRVSQPLNLSKIYLLKINNTRISGTASPVVRIEADSKMAVRVYNEPGQYFELHSRIEIDPASIKVRRTKMEVTDDGKFLKLSPEPVEAIVPEGGDYFPTEIELQLKKRLAENRNHYFVVDGLSDDGRKLSATGKITVPGLPPPTAKPVIDVNLSSEVGGNIKPQFNFLGVFKYRFIGSESSFFRLEPLLTYDLGLGATKSKNALTLDVPIAFTEVAVQNIEGACRSVMPPSMAGDKGRSDDPRLTDGDVHHVPLNCYNSWKSHSPFSLRSMGISSGPKFETNKSFTKINALARTLFTLNFHRWQNSVAEQQRYIALDLDRGQTFRDYWRDVPIDFGFSITPRFGFEAGRKLTTETITNKSGSISHVIAPYPILRAFAGFEQVYEFNNLPLPAKLTITEDLFYIAATESIGDIKDNRLMRRDVRGFHPYGKVVLDLFFDRARRYSFTVSYENGRAAPNFEYLNTLRSGIRLIR